MSGRVRHRRALLCTRERVLFIERHHSAPEILRGKDSRRAWEIEGILLARTRLSPSRAEKSSHSPKTGARDPRPTPHAMAHGASSRAQPVRSCASLSRGLCPFSERTAEVFPACRSAGARGRVLGLDANDAKWIRFKLSKLSFKAHSSVEKCGKCLCAASRGHRAALASLFIQLQ